MQEQDEVVAVWAKDKESGAWIVMAELLAARTGTVPVTRKDGTAEIVEIEPPGKDYGGFEAKFGPLQGLRVAFCALAGSKPQQEAAPPAMDPPPWAEDDDDPIPF